MKSLQGTRNGWLLTALAILMYVALAQSSSLHMASHSKYRCPSIRHYGEEHLQAWLHGNYSQLLTQLNESETSLSYAFYRNEISTKLNEHQVIILEDRSNAEKVKEVIGAEKCDELSQQEWFGMQKSFCPHHFDSIIRYDRYPRKIMRAVRNCALGTDLVQSRFGHLGECAAIRILKPVMQVNSQTCQLEFAMEYHIIAFIYAFSVEIV